VACGFVLDGGSKFPGSAALWPTVCGALVLLGGVTRSRYGPHRLLLLRPVQFLGGVSYPLYLWHWPVLVFALVIEGRDRLDAAGGAAVVVVSVLLAVATHHLVERPVRALPTAAGRRWVAVGLAVVYLATAVWQGDARRLRERAALDAPGRRAPQRPVPRPRGPGLRADVLPGGDRQRAGLPRRQPSHRLLRDVDGRPDRG
jgi:hypothetical protein